jgi:hypothetical protein
MVWPVTKRSFATEFFSHRVHRGHRDLSAEALAKAEMNKKKQCLSVSFSLCYMLLVVGPSDTGYFNYGIFITGTA